MKRKAAKVFLRRGLETLFDMCLIEVEEYGRLLAGLEKGDKEAVEKIERYITRLVDILEQEAGE